MMSDNEQLLSSEELDTLHAAMKLTSKIGRPDISSRLAALLVELAPRGWWSNERG